MVEANVENFSHILSWTQDNTDYTIYRNGVIDSGNVQYYMKVSKYNIVIRDDVPVKEIIAEESMSYSADKLIDFLAEPTIVKISGYVGDIPESPLTVTVDGKNIEIKICNNKIIYKNGFEKTIYGIKYMIDEFVGKITKSNKIQRGEAIRFERTKIKTVGDINE